MDRRSNFSAIFKKRMFLFTQPFCFMKEEPLNRTVINSRYEIASNCASRNFLRHTRYETTILFPGEGGRPEVGGVAQGATAGSA